MRAERQTDEQTMSGIPRKLEMGAKAEQNRDQKKIGITKRIGERNE